MHNMRMHKVWGKNEHLAFWPGRRPAWLIWPGQKHFHSPQGSAAATWCNRRRISRSICRDRVNLVPCARAHCLPYTRPPACRPACLPASLSTCLFIHTKQAYCVLWLFPIWNYRNAFRDAATSQCCVASTSRASLAVASFPVFWEQLCTAGLWKSICVIM